MKFVMLIVMMVLYAGLVYAQDIPEAVPDSVNTQGNVSDSLTAPEMLDYKASYLQGTVDGAKHSAAGWRGGGFLCGYTLNLVGTTIITTAACGNKPVFIPENCDEKGYSEGYYRKTKTKNKWAAFGGGMLGTGVFYISLLIVAGSISVNMTGG